MLPFILVNLSVNCCVAVLFMNNYNITTKVWQHCDCMDVEPDQTDRYLCEECDPRPYSKEVKVIPPPADTPPGHTYYVTLLRDDLLVKQGPLLSLINRL